MTFTPEMLTNLAYFFTNTDRQALEEAGIIQPGRSGDDKWERFNHNFDIFILKSDDKQLEALAKLANAYVGKTTPPPHHKMVATSAPEILSRIAEVAAAVGFQAGEPAMELAGQIVSVLAGQPEHIERFMEQGTGLFLDGTFGIENGTLTYRAINGQILSPSVIREKKGTQQ